MGIYSRRASYVWLLPLGALFLRFVHVVKRMGTSFLSVAKEIQQFIYPFVCGWTFGCSTFGYCKWCCCEHSCVRSWVSPYFHFFGHILITGIAGSYGSFIFNFFKICFWSYYSACRILFLHQDKPAPPALEVEIKHWPPGKSLYLSFWGNRQTFHGKSSWKLFYNPTSNAGVLWFLHFLEFKASKTTLITYRMRKWPALETFSFGHLILSLSCSPRLKACRPGGRVALDDANRNSTGLQILSCVMFRQAPQACASDQAWVACRWAGSRRLPPARRRWLTLSLTTFTSWLRTIWNMCCRYSNPDPSQAKHPGCYKTWFPVQDEVERTLKQCLDKFDVVPVDTARTIFNQVMEKEFEDGIVNWGRIVTIFAFEGILTKKLLSKRIASDMDMCKDISALRRVHHQKHRRVIRQNGGWVCVMEVFFFVLYFKIGIEITSFFANLKRNLPKGLYFLLSSLF